MANGVVVADAVGLLEALRVDLAHVVGVSMGGGIAMHLGLDYADRIASLTRISTSPGGPDLPPMSDELSARFDEPSPEPDWSDRQAVIDYTIEDLRAFAGTLPFAEEEMRALVGRIVDRTVNIESSMKNHWILEGGEPLRSRLGEIPAPTLGAPRNRGPAVPLRPCRSARRRDPRRSAIAARRNGPRGAASPGLGSGSRRHPRPHCGAVMAEPLN